MNAKINALNKKLEALEAEMTVVQQPVMDKARQVKAELRTEYDKFFAKDKNLQAALVAVEASNEYGADDAGIYQWARFNMCGDYNDCMEYLRDYCQERGIDVDYDNDALRVYLGGCIIINDDGDVLDQESGKWIVSKDDYETESERNKLIEAWMEQNGYFPGVFREDRYGNVFHVNTQSEKSA